MYGIARMFTLRVADDPRRSWVDGDLFDALLTGGMSAFLSVLDSRGPQHRERFEAFVKHIVDPGPVVDRPAGLRSGPLLKDEP